MKLLAVETSTERCSVALLLGDKIVVNETLAGQRHSELLLGMVEELLQAHHIKVRDIDAFAFGAGPGSFTGLRIACGVVQGMAFGTHKKVVGISSLLALADAAAKTSGANRVIAALDARMGETYFGAFEIIDGFWQTLIEPCVVDHKSLPHVDGGGWCAVGSGFDAHGYLADQYRTQLGHVLTGQLPSAREIARLAAMEFAAGRAIDPELAAPLYVRNKVAMTAAERAEHRVSRAALVKT